MPTKPHGTTSDRETKELTFKRTGRCFALVSLNSREAMRARSFAGPGADAFTQTAYRAAVAIRAIDGKPLYPIVTDETTMDARLEALDSVELDWLTIQYDQLFALSAEDLGNGSGTEGSPPSS